MKDGGVSEERKVAFAQYMDVVAPFNAVEKDLGWVYANASPYDKS